MRKMNVQHAARQKREAGAVPPETGAAAALCELRRRFSEGRVESPAATRLAH